MKFDALVSVLVTAVAVAVAVAAQSPVNQVGRCEPGRRWLVAVGGLECLCAGDGSGALCSNGGVLGQSPVGPRMLRALQKSGGGSEASPLGQVCQPGSRFREACNLCLCSADGSRAACTRMLCHPNV